MTILVTGSAGHLGEAIMRLLRADGRSAIGLDIAPSPYTDIVGSIVDRTLVDGAMKGIDAVIHTATLHKPHVATHTRQEFIDTNITGTLNLLETAAEARVSSFIFTSTTSVFGDALVPAPGAPAAWITEDVAPRPKNIYGITKRAAEELGRLFARKHSLPVTVLRTSRFFPEEDDRRAVREAFADENAKANEFLFRRVDIEDAARAHLIALDRRQTPGFDLFIISATTPFTADDLGDLRSDPSAVMRRRLPELYAEFERRGWKMFDEVDRVYVNQKARNALGWNPRYDHRFLLERLRADEPVPGPMAQAVGAKGYHAERFEEGPYPVE
ncbi:NAD-dependent epimerase/dehydratase family protein [Hoeflea poritis]|uniref:NAD(P)-dependent oxidoreductase n=1 Tax=Hoeflea poritis TaxID=2993659 RepID=A0ABT4VPA6_9HYPH|nr:NAD(P)-dependent oxidoreductase [Hoeflea poritis]MDA4846459.1 NAD(P)-dependent oxidoreductase [Hoeflea poritis]